ncbi:MAG: YybH family protein [Alphaproteobacteria bacterium]
MSVEDAIRDADARFVEAFNRGDLAAVVALHSADALILGPDSPAERGGQAVEEDFKELLDAGWKNIELGSVQIGSGGDLGYHVGTLAADIPTKGGSVQRVTGKFIDIYKPDAAGSWKIHVTMFNFDAPLSE